MSKLLSKISAWLQRLALATIRPSSQQPALEWSEALLSAAILMLLVVVLSACATTPKPSCEMPPPPPLPALTEQLPSESYSTQWLKLVQSLRAKLIVTPPMSER